MGRNVVAVALTFCIGAAANSLPASAEPTLGCGKVHTIAQGDTLFLLAEHAYGNGRLFKTIFDANLDLMPDAGTVEIGDQILIPCLDGTGPHTRRDAIALGYLVGLNDQVATSLQRSETSTLNAQDPVEPAGDLRQASSHVTGKVASAPGNTKTPFRFLTGSGFGPFSEKTLDGGGLITDLVQNSVLAVVPNQAIHVAFINDWSAHLETLLRDGAYEVGFPWYKPDCANPDKLSEELRMRCAEFAFSNPIFEVAFAFFARAGDPVANLANRDDLIGRRICRVKGQFLFDHDLLDQLIPILAIDVAATASECLTRLTDGRVDLVALIEPQSAAEIQSAGMSDKVTEVHSLGFRQTIHAVAFKSNPIGLAYLDVINQGLATMMASGRWFTVITPHFPDELVNQCHEMKILL